MSSIRLTILLLSVAFRLSAQQAGVTLKLSECVYNTKKGELNFRITLYNKSADTVHVLSAFPLKLFAGSRLPSGLFGLKNRPFSVSSRDLSSCSAGVVSAEMEEKDTRYNLPPEQFVDIPPGEERQLGYVTLGKKDICFTAAPTAPFPMKLIYEVSAVNPAYFSQQETAELQSVWEEFEALKKEMYPLRPRIFFDLAGVDSYVKHFAGYQQLLNKLQNTRLISEEAMVQLE